MQFSTLLVAFFTVSTAFALPIAEPNAEETSLHNLERRGAGGQSSDGGLPWWLQQHPKHQGVDLGCKQGTTTSKPAKVEWRCRYLVKDVEVKPGKNASGQPIVSVTGEGVATVDHQPVEQFSVLAMSRAMNDAKWDTFYKARAVREWNAQSI
ncbi:hypothetical protein M408DRAFT_21110 [Serendipita vermifera MAFF 305830]|uniref:Uncharacterized protein n=1 Tax=Serendipita vermifera MAFF 305830 TaxID=933852 RepID=A0A0C3BK99_SERVB|nr:hypothetical protein M408DRAFT_21110 [Serendipita vermifera MAFF 305830]